MKGTLIPLIITCCLLGAGAAWGQSTDPEVTPFPGPHCAAPAPSDPDLAPTTSTIFGASLQTGVILTPVVLQLVPARLVAWLSGLRVQDLSDPRAFRMRRTGTAWGRVSR
jgi:hypothetical protein